MTTPAFPKGYENENNLNIEHPPSAPIEPANYNEGTIFTPDGDRETWQTFVEGIPGDKNTENNDDEKKQQIQPVIPNNNMQSMTEQKIIDNIANIDDIKEIKHYNTSDNIMASYIIKPLPAKDFNSTQIVQNLYKYIDTGMKLKMTAKRMEQFNNIIFKTDIKQRQLIKTEYHKLYNEDLMSIISNKFTWHQIYKELLSLLMMSNQQLNTHIIETVLRTMKDIKLLCSILCICDNKNLKEIQALYNARHGNSLDKRVDSFTSNMWGKITPINKFLLQLLKCERKEDNGLNMNDIDMDLVKKDASNLLLTIISVIDNKKKKLDSDIFHEIFSKRSFNHLYFVSIQFELSNISSLSLYETVMNIYNETNDKLFYAIGVMLLWLHKCDEYYANLLGDSIYNHGPSYVMFFRIIVERHNIDLKNIIDVYGRMALKKWIKYDFMKKDIDAAMLINILCGLQMTLK